MMPPHQQRQLFWVVLAMVIILALVFLIGMPHRNIHFN